MKTFKIANINTQQHQAIFTKYIAMKAMYDATKVKLEKAGIFTKVFSAGNCDGLKNLDIDLQEYRASKKRLTQEVSDKLDELSKLGKKCLPDYREYLNKLSLQTSNIQREMEIIRNGILKYNNNQTDLARLYGKYYSTVKFGADLGVEVLSNRTGPVGQVISFLYGLTNETIGTITNAENADAWNFSGSLATPHLMAWDHITEDIAKTNKAVKTINHANSFLSGVLITKEFKDNLDKFE